MKTFLDNGFLDIKKIGRMGSGSWVSVETLGNPNFSKKWCFEMAPKSHRRNAWHPVSWGKSGRIYKCFPDFLCWDKKRRNSRKGGLTRVFLKNSLGYVEGCLYNSCVRVVGIRETFIYYLFALTIIVYY